MTNPINDIISQSANNISGVQQANSQLQNIANSIQNEYGQFQNNISQLQNQGNQSLQDMINQLNQPLPQIQPPQLPQPKTSIQGSTQLPNNMVLGNVTPFMYNALMTEDPTTSEHVHGKTVATWLSPNVPAQMGAMVNGANYPELTNMLSNLSQEGQGKLQDYINQQKTAYQNYLNQLKQPLTRKQQQAGAITDLIKNIFAQRESAMQNYINQQMANINQEIGLAPELFANTWESPNPNTTSMNLSMAGNQKPNQIMQQYQNKYQGEQDKLNQEKQQYLNQLYGEQSQLQNQYQQTQQQDQQSENQIQQQLGQQMGGLSQQYNSQIDALSQQYNAQLNNIQSSIQNSLQQLTNANTASALVMGASSAFLEQVYNRISNLITPQSYQQSIQNLQNVYNQDQAFANSYTNLFQNYLGMNANLIDSLKQVQSNIFSGIQQGAQQAVQSLHSITPTATALENQNLATEEGYQYSPLGGALIPINFNQPLNVPNVTDMNSAITAQNTQNEANNLMQNAIFINTHFGLTPTQWAQYIQDNGQAPTSQQDVDWWLQGQSWTPEGG